MSEHREPVHPRAQDKRFWPAGIYTVAIDAAGCVVVHTHVGPITVTDVAALTDALTEAKAWRDALADHAYVSAAPHGHPDRCAYARSMDDASGACFRPAAEHPGVGLSDADALSQRGMTPVCIHEREGDPDCQACRGRAPGALPRPGDDDYDPDAHGWPGR